MKPSKRVKRGGVKKLKYKLPLLGGGWKRGGSLPSIKNTDPQGRCFFPRLYITL